MGYHRAGFEVVGVDIKPQPRYPFEFHQGDAMEYPLEGFDVIHASPMWLGFTCQRFRTTDEGREDTVTPIYDRLRQSGLPWVCESGSLGPLRDAALFCGPAYGLKVIRHMWFASSELILTAGCVHVPGGCVKGLYIPNRGSYHKDRKVKVPTQRRAYAREAGIEWMHGRQADLAVPPAYTEHIGKALLNAI